MNYEISGKRDFTHEHRGCRGIFFVSVSLFYFKNRNMEVIPILCELRFCI